MFFVDNVADVDVDVAWVLSSAVALATGSTGNSAEGFGGSDLVWVDEAAASEPLVSTTSWAAAAEVDAEQLEADASWSEAAGWAALETVFVSPLLLSENKQVR